jgi:WD40 repeat protein
VFILNDFIIKTMELDQAEETTAVGYGAPGGAAAVRRDGGGVRLRGYHTASHAGHAGRVKALAVARHQETYLSASIDDCVVSQVSLRDGEEVGLYAAHSSPIICMAFSTDARLFASGGRDGCVALWETQVCRESNLRRKVRFCETDDSGGAIPIALAFTHNDRYVVAGYQDCECRVWDVAKAAMAGGFALHSRVVVCVAAHPAKLEAVTGGADRRLLLWAVPTGDVVQEFEGHGGAVIAVSFAPDGTRVLSNDDRECRVWEAATGQVLLRLSLDEALGPVRSLSNTSIAAAAGLANASFGFGGSDSLSGHPHVVPSSDATSSSAPTTVASPNPSPRQRRLSILSAGSAGDCVLPSKKPPAALQGLQGPHSISRARTQNRSTLSSQRLVFTVSALLPGELANAYFAVACSNGSVYLHHLASGEQVGQVATRAPVFALSSAAGGDALMMGDVFGNIYRTTVEAGVVGALA